MVLLSRRGRDAGGEDVAVRRHRPDYQIVLYMGLLMLLGLIIMYAIGPQRANVLNNSYNTNYYTSTYFFLKQSASLLIAMVVFAAMALVPYHFVQRHAKKMLIVGFASCIVLAIAGFVHLGIAQCSLGACRWYNLGPLGSLQPAEVLKFGMVVFMAGFLSIRMRRGLINDFDKTLIPFLAVASAAIFLIVVVEKDMGTGISLIAILASLLIVGGLNKRIGMMLCIGMLIVGTVLVMMAPHRRDRIITFLRGDKSTTANSDSDYQIRHAKIAIGSGGFMGVGIGNSVQATGYLPEAINDSVFAIMGETFGFVGLTVILLIFTALLMRLLRIVDHLRDPWMRLVVAGAFGWLASHVVLNVASMIGLIPLTGITLPLLSFGGTSIIFISGALGLAFQLSRYTVHGSVGKEADYESISSRRGVGRPRHAGRRSSSRA